MDQIFSLVFDNITSPMVLFFGLGVGASLLRSDLEIPQSVARILSIYLMLAIGFKGGAAVADNGIEFEMVATLVSCAILSFITPFIAYFLLRRMSNLPTVDVAAVAAHYGSISVVTLAAAMQVLKQLGLDYEGYIIAAAAVMEFPAIISGLWLAKQFARSDTSTKEGLFRHVFLNGSIVVLFGAFIIGWVSGDGGLSDIAPFIIDPFNGVLCLFLLDMGIVAGRGFRDKKNAIGPREISFGLAMPLFSIGLATVFILILDLSVGGAALLFTLAASASYIAVPAAMRFTLPRANPAVYITMSLGVTFPFNLTIGIPIYIALARLIA
ncbi:MAG: sodium-dependent bicarbonate transport family permease [Acidiferrobacteraceae bacterium]|mgnify:CR=1 FL=1|nr:sodium-dependent bicarbonate transport family permease [Acidiferrobacteraceae bacterium]